jgi:hypothetical protein
MCQTPPWNGSQGHSWCSLESKVGYGATSRFFTIEMSLEGLTWLNGKEWY